MDDLRITIDKKTALRAYSVVRQSAFSLHRSKLAWDAEDGWKELRTFYAQQRGKQLREMLQDLQQIGSVSVSLEDRVLLRKDIDNRFPRLLYLFAPLLAVLSRYRYSFSFRKDEIAYIISCLNSFAEKIDDPLPPTAEEGRSIAGELISANTCIEARCWFMPAFVRAHRIEHIYLPPFGPYYSLEEVLQQLN